MDIQRLASDMFRKQQEETKKESRLPFEEKIRILIKMQEQAAELHPDPEWTVWRLQTEDEDPPER